MVLEQVLVQLRAELRRVQEAIVVLERLAENLQQAKPKRANSMNAQKMASGERKGTKAAAEE